MGLAFITPFTLSICAVNHLTTTDSLVRGRGLGTRLLCTWLLSMQEGHSVFEKDSAVRGHHIYKKNWTPVLGDELTIMTEDDNKHDEHTVAIRKHGNVVGHAHALFIAKGILVNAGARVNLRLGL